MRFLRMLGTFGVLHDGAPIEALATHRKAMAILAILAAGGAVSRDRMMALLWPDSDIDRARGSLKQAVHLLRRHLDAPKLLGGRAELSLDRSIVDTDVHQFRDAIAAGEWSRAVQIYHGPFLDGIHLGGSSELEEWIDTTRAVLARECAGALECLATAAEVSGDREAAVGWWRQRQGQDPWDSRVALRLMRALVAAGQRGAALQHAHVHEALLRTDLDLAPDAAVIAYVEELRRSNASTAAIHGETRTPVGAVDGRHPTNELDSPPPVPERVGSTATRWRVMLPVGVVVLLAGSIAISRWSSRTNGRADFDPDLVAVASFGVTDAGLELWREGLGDILAQDLDGAGPLRTLAPAVALRRGTVSDRTSAERFGERTGVGIVVFGNVVRRGTDSVQIRATVLDREHDASEQVEVVGAEVRIGELADSLGVRVLRFLGERRPIASVRHVSIGSRSLPALKSFLRGEQFYRQGEGDSALKQFDLAVRADSTFALAMRRMVWLLGTFAPSDELYAPRLDYLRRAIRMNHGLSPRDSALIVADSAYHLTPEATTADGMIGSLFHAVRSLEALANRYPDDPAVWYDLAELRAHLVPPLGGDAVTALDAFDRAIALDSGFAPAYVHTIALALQLGDLERARTYSRRYVATHASNRANAAPPALRLLSAIFDSGGITAPYVLSSVRALGGHELHWVATDNLRWWADTAETAIVLLQSLRSGVHTPGRDRVADTLMHAQALSLALAFRGHVAEAVRVNAVLFDDASASRFSHHLDAFAELAVLGMIDTAVARRAFAPALAPGNWLGGSTHLPPRYLRGLPWWFARGDSVSIERMMQRGIEVARAADRPLSMLRGRYYHEAAAAYLTLLRGDSAGALQRFTALPDSLCLVVECLYEKLLLARLHAARGNDRTAASLYKRWTRTGLAGPLAVRASLEHARIAERLGDRTTARRLYQFVLDAWRKADPTLQPYVREAREGVRRLAR